MAQNITVVENILNANDRLAQSNYDRLEVADADALSASLADDGIGSAPGDAFGPSYPDALRFSFSCDTAMVREGSVRLREALL